MSEIMYELVCDSCGADYQINYVDNESKEYVDEPMYCPFCGTDIDLTDVEEELDDEEEYIDELDFEDR